jgi:hypothetical protein
VLGVKGYAYGGPRSDREYADCSSWAARVGNGGRARRVMRPCADRRGSGRDGRAYVSVFCVFSYHGLVAADRKMVVCRSGRTRTGWLDAWGG